MPEPKLFISYSHDSTEHKQRILALANRLVQEGVDCEIDQYQQSPAEGWPRWCERQVERAAFVVVVCTETYWRRFRGEEAPGTGLGGTWEGHIITQELYNAQGRNTKFIPVTLGPEDGGFVPLPLQSATLYRLYGDYASLYGRIVGKPLISKPVLGGVAQKAPWQVPHRQNAFFTGREKVLADLGAALERRGSAALSGLGGAGKTHTAIEYVYRSRERYRAVFWVKAESGETLTADFAAAAALLKLPSAQAANLELAVAELRRWLDDNPGWLLVLDNADDLALVQDFLPNTGKGHLLLTTQAQATDSLAERIPVRELDWDEGALLLLRRAGVIAKDAPLSAAGGTDREAARRLSEELGGLPLALDQAGAFIEETSRSVSEYAAIYASEKATLLAERGQLGEHAPVKVTFSLAFDKVEGKSAAAGDLIRVCAFLAPEAIPEEIFTAGAAALGKNLGAAVANPLSWARVIGQAVRSSLLIRDAATQALSIHRLVQIVIKARMPRADQRKWAERAVRATGHAFPDVEYANWGLCQKLLTHAQTCASLIEEWKFDFVEGATLLNQAAFYLSERALFDKAEPLYLRSLTISEKALGAKHPDVATSLNNLAVLYNSQGRYEEADPLYRRALTIWESKLGAEDPMVALALNNLGELCRNRERYAEAEPLYKRALAIRRKVLGPDHPSVATSLNNLGLLYRAQEKYAEAEPLYEHSLAILELARGAEHPDVASSLNNIATLYQCQGKYAEAERLYKRSLAISERVLGAEHPAVAISVGGLGALYFYQGKYSQAKPLFQRALAIFQKALGPQHPRTKDARSDLDACPD